MQTIRMLEHKFGSDVERKNKSIKIHGNTYRKDADSVPCRRYRDYRKANVRDRSAIHYGTALLCIENPDEIQGQYFTDRKTTGDMKFIPE